MFLLVPYHVDVPMRAVPWMNWILIGLTVLFYPLCWAGSTLTPLGSMLVLGGESWLGVPGHVLVHGDVMHLAGNMLFLWAFGNAVCAKVGNFVYPLVYFGLGAAAGALSYLIDPRPAIGASGAINGIVGMFFVWYLLNEVTCWWVYWIWSAAESGTLSMSSFWLIVFWLAFDVWGAFKGEGNVGYVAHLAGLGQGVLLAILMLKRRWVKMAAGGRSLVQILQSSAKKSRRTQPKRPTDDAFRM